MNEERCNGDYSCSLQTSSVHVGKYRSAIVQPPASACKLGGLQRDLLPSPMDTLQFR